MVGVLEGFATIAALAGIGWLLAHRGVLDLSAQHTLSRLAFTVASPALLLTVLQRTPLDRVISLNLVVSAASVVVIVGLYLLISRGRWGATLGDRVIAALTAAYVNAGNLGLPIALYVLGDVAWVAPTLLLQLLVITPIAMALLDADAAEARRSPARIIGSVFTNPITLGALTGLLLTVLHVQLPRVVGGILDLLGAMAVPSMLIAFGISLRLGPRPASGDSAPHVRTLVLLKTIGQPLVAWGLALAVGLRGPALFAVVVVAALPTAQNVFTYAVRYNRSLTLARDVIFITTFVSFAVILGIAALFHWSGVV